MFIKRRKRNKEIHAIPKTRKPMYRNNLLQKEIKILRMIPHGIFIC